jgi:hypothetical protein
VDSDEPVRKSHTWSIDSTLHETAALMATAVECDSDRLVIWQISRSPRANFASTTAGRRLLA